MSIIPINPVPIVSVLVLAFNHETYIAQTIESILGQMVDFDIEIIIGEDFSTDRTNQICAEYCEKFSGVVTLVASEQNVGMHENLARIWQRARGEYIALCEGDDYWCHTGKLASQVAFLDAHPSYSLCGTYTKRIKQDADGEWAEAGRIGPPAVKDAYYLKDLIPDYCFHTSSVLVRKNAVRFPPWFQQMYCADRPLYLLCAEQGPAGFIPEVMSTYRLHGGGIWSPVTLLAKSEKSRDLFETLDRHFGYRYHRLITRTLGNILWSYMAEAVVAADLPTAKRLFWQASSYFLKSGRVDMLRHWSVAVLRLYLPGAYTLLKSRAV